MKCNTWDCLKADFKPIALKNFSGPGLSNKIL